MNHIFVPPLRRRRRYTYTVLPLCLPFCLSLTKISVTFFSARHAIVGYFFVPNKYQLPIKCQLLLKSGDITSEHWLTDILFHFANILPYNWKVSLSNAVWFYKTFNFLLSNIFKLEQKYDTSLVVHNKKIGELFILLAFQQSKIPR